MVDQAKRNLLRGSFSSEPASAPIRPPNALSEVEFAGACTRCGDCISKCPLGIIKVGQGGYPELDFSQRGCDFCGECVAVCATGALEKKEPLTLSGRASIGKGCLAYNGVECRSCEDACEVRAIKFRLQINKVAEPQLDQNTCTGCGECVSYCPKSVIEIKHL